MKVFKDITRPLTPDLPIWPGDTPYAYGLTADIPAQGYRAGYVRLSTHCGTHVDAPAHYLPDGATTDALPWETLLGDCYVLDLRGDRWNAQRVLPAPVTRLLLRTDNSQKTGEDWLRRSLALTLACANRLIHQGVQLLGIDGPSVEAFDGDGSVHTQLLRQGVVLLEGLDLTDVPQGWYRLVCCPLAIAAEGAPVRALLLASPHASTTKAGESSL